MLPPDHQLYAAEEQQVPLQPRSAAAASQQRAAGRVQRQRRETQQPEAANPEAASKAGMVAALAAKQAEFQCQLQPPALWRGMQSPDADQELQSPELQGQPQSPAAGVSSPASIHDQRQEMQRGSPASVEGQMPSQQRQQSPAGDGDAGTPPWMQRVVEKVAAVDASLQEGFERITQQAEAATRLAATAAADNAALQQRVQQLQQQLMQPASQPDSAAFQAPQQQVLVMSDDDDSADADLHADSQNAQDAA